MGDRPISRIKYDADDLDFVEENFGIEDPTPGDGHVKWEELHPQLQDFYADLTTEEYQALKKYRLGTNSFSQSRDLATITRKYIQWKYFEDHHLPQDLDETLFDSHRNFPIPLKRPDRLFDGLTIDLKSIREDKKLYEIIMEADLSCLQTITLEILRDFISANQHKDHFKISRDEWERAYHRLNCEVDPPYSANTTWNEMISIWHSSEPRWNMIMNDHIFGSATGGMVRVAKQDMTITAAGIWRYAANPKRHVLINRSPIVSTDHMDIHDEAIWPDVPTEITLMEKMGFALNLNIEPGARMIANQKIREGNLVFDVTEPLLYLEGFGLDVDANNKFTRGLAGLGQWLTSWFGKDFDIGLYNLFAVTVYQNRLCLVFNGDHQNNDFIDPIRKDDYLFLDVTGIVKGMIDDFDTTGEISRTFFDEAGDVRSEIPMRTLQDAVIKAFQTGSTKSLPAHSPLTGFRNELWVEDIRIDLTDVVDRQGKLIDAFEITDGRIYSDMTWPSEIKVQGQLELSLGIDSDYITDKDGDHNFTAQLEFLIDSQQQVGFAKLKIPEVLLAGLSSQVDGAYEGDVYIALPPEIFDAYKGGELTVEDVLQTIGVHVLVELQKNHQDYLAAALHFRYAKSETEYFQIQKLLMDYQIAFAEEDKSLHGVISGGEFVALQQMDPSNYFLAQEFEVAAKYVVSGGLIKLFGEEAVIKVSQDVAGTWYFEPAYQKGSIHTKFDAETNGFHGLIMAEPVYDSQGEIIAFDIHVDELAINVPRVEIQFKNNKKLVGRTQAIIHDGTWRVRAGSILDLFKTVENWEGRGTLELVNVDTHLQVIDMLTGEITEFHNKKLGTNFNIQLIKFNPFNITGSLAEVLDKGVVGFENEYFSFRTDVSGGIELREAQLPIISFKSDDVFGEEPAKPSPEVKETQELQQDVDVDSILDDKFRYYMEKMLDSPRSIFRFKEIDLSSDLLVNGADSLTSLSVDVDHAQFYAQGDYKSSHHAHLPLIKGFFSFLNPRVKEGTEFHLQDAELVVENNRLQKIEWKLNQPISFLGFQIQGIAIDEPRNAVAAKKSARFFIVTNHYRINPICLLKLRFPFKMMGFYGRVNKRLRDEGRTVELGRNEIPTDLGDLMIFMDELMETLEWDEKIIQQQNQQYKKFLKSDFVGISNVQLDHLEEKLSVFPQTPPDSSKNKRKQIVHKLNQLTRFPLLVDSFTEEMINDTFSGDTKSQVLDLIEEIHEIRDEFHFAVKRKYVRRIYRLNSKLLHLYVKQFVAPPQIFDINDLEKIAIESELRPRVLDGGMVEIDKDNNDDVSLDVVYMPQERDDEIVAGDETPYLSVQFANKPGEKVEHVNFDFLNRHMFFQGEFDFIAGIELYMGGPLAEGAPFSFKIREFDSHRDLKIVHAPEGYERPAFALVTTDHATHRQEHDNIIRGSELFVTRNNSGHYLSGVTFNHAVVHEGYLYFTYSDDVSGDIRDVFIDQTATEYQDFKIEMGLQTFLTEDDLISYNFTTIDVNGGLILEDHPDAIPRAYIYTGTNDKGDRKYIELKRVTGDGQVDVDFMDISYAGNITIESEIPQQVLEHPFVLALQDQGVTLNLTGIEVTGSFEFKLNGLAGGITRLDRSKVETEFIPTEFILKGELGIESHGKSVTIKDLRIPIEELDMVFVEVENSDGTTRQTPIMRSFEVPALEDIEAQVSAQIDLPKKIGSGTLGLTDAHFSLVTESGIQFGMDDPETFHLDSVGAQATFRDEGYANRVDLSAGEIHFHDDKGHIQNWEISAEFEELIQAIVSLSLQGERADFTLKP